MSRRFSVVECDQRTPEWFAARLGRLTGSVAGDMLANGKGNAEAVSRRNLRVQLALERVTGRPVGGPVFVTQAMQDGIDREAEARAEFEAATGELVYQTGFLQHVDHLAGASLDGHMGDFDMLVSIKCRQPAAHLEFLKSKAIPADALAQIQHELWLTGARRHFYVNFNPDFPPALRLSWVELDAAKLDIEAYEASALAFLSEVAKEAEAIAALSANIRQIDQWRSNREVA